MNKERLKEIFKEKFFKIGNVYSYQGKLFVMISITEDTVMSSSHPEARGNIFQENIALFYAQKQEFGLIIDVSLVSHCDEILFQSIKNAKTFSEKTKNPEPILFGMKDEVLELYNLFSGLGLKSISDLQEYQLYELMLN